MSLIVVASVAVYARALDTAAARELCVSTVHLTISRHHSLSPVRALADPRGIRSPHPPGLSMGLAVPPPSAGKEFCMDGWIMGNL